jgi:hypothetical protein
MALMKGFITLVALALLVFVGVGFLLSGEWSAQRERQLSVPPEAVRPFLVDLARWPEWSSVGQVEGELSSPSAGVGATMSWDDPQWGQGVVTLTEVGPDEVAYEVRVEDGSLRTRGRIHLTPREGGTRVVWLEEGDFGWNPLLSWFALGMDRIQGAELEKSLDALSEAVGGAA